MQMVTVKEYAMQNKISVNTVRKLIKDDLLEYVRFGRVIRIPENALPIEVMTAEENKCKCRSEKAYKDALKKICKVW